MEEYIFSLLDLQTLSNEYWGEIPPRKIRYILHCVKLAGMEQARQALDLYHADQATKEIVDNFIQERQNALERILF